MTRRVSFAKPREMVAFDGERCTPWVTTQILAAHVHRYLSVLDICQGKRVLDIACGEGYGAGMLIRNGAMHVTGVDIDTDAVERAARVYAAEGLDFVRADIRHPLPFADARFDVVVCFETLEHIAEQDAFIEELARVLAPDGALIISTPDATKSDPGAPNPFHEKELNEADFVALLSAHFPHIRVHTQGYLFGSIIEDEHGKPRQTSWDRKGFVDYEEDGGARLRHYFLATASRTAEISLPTGVLHDHAILSSLNNRIRELEAQVIELRDKTPEGM